MQLSLALQGGGAHGAFTWGALDRLLELPGLRIHAISATSSGAMNACALAQGWATDGAAGARAALAAFWEDLARQQAVANWWVATARTLFPLAAWPAVAGPMPYNGLQGLVEGFFDMRAIRRGPVQLHLAATRVDDGQLEVFSDERISHDALLASACVPQLWPPVAIDGALYWDGGYAGNPALEPLLGRSGTDDILCILLQPVVRASPAARGADVAERAAQLGFAAAFQRELRDLELSRERLRQRWWLSRHERRLARLRIHMLRPPRALAARDGSSAMDTRVHHLRQLHALGRGAAERWLLDTGRIAAPGGPA